MRKNRFLFVVMLFAALSLGFVSCDDNKGNEPDDPATEQGGSTENNGGEETPEPETPTPADPYNGHAYVDLGLPSGLKWATCNVGATTPEGYGDYFAWGETATKSEYTSENYAYTETSEILPLSNDAVVVNMGGEWRMPTYEEQTELRTECTWTWTDDYNGTGVAGRIVTSKINGNSIFLPAAGCSDGSGLDGAGAGGGYWSSSLNTDYSGYAYSLGFDSDGVNWNGSYRYYGRSVRGVIE